MLEPKKPNPPEMNPRSGWLMQIIIHIGETWDGLSSVSHPMIADVLPVHSILTLIELCESRLLPGVNPINQS